MRPTLLPCPRAVSPRGRPSAQAQYFLGESRPPVRREGSPLPLVPGKASAPRSCTTRRASPPRFEGSLDTLHEGASSDSPWQLALVSFNYTKPTQLKGALDKHPRIRGVHFCD